jgi:hypothetical protein
MLTSTAQERAIMTAGKCPCLDQKLGGGHARIVQSSAAPHSLFGSQISLFSFEKIPVPWEQGFWYSTH